MTDETNPQIEEEDALEPTLDHLISTLVWDRELALRFFVAFSRFEFALKQTTFAFACRDDDSVCANWRRFCDTKLEGHFQIDQQEASVREAIAYLQERPTRRQVWRNGSLGFDVIEQGARSDVRHLVELVKAIRNNLFHGGKYPFDPVRDNGLLQCGLTLLTAWLDYDPQVKQAFYWS